MTIQKTAFEVQSALRTAHGIDIKRSHVHEVLAALLGHASYAAMSSQCVIAQFLGQASLRPLDIVGAAQRAQALGYAPPGPPVIATVGAEAALNTHRLCAMKLDDVLSALGFADTTGDGLDLSGNADFEDSVPDSAGSRLELDLEAGGLRDELARLAIGGSASAHLALTGFIDEQLDEDDPIEGPDGRYWSDQLEAGRTLSGVELEWAETYKRHRDLRSQRQAHLERAATLGNAEAAIKLAEADFSAEAFDAAALLAQRVLTGDHASGAPSRTGQTGIQDGANSTSFGRLNERRRKCHSSHLTQPLTGGRLVCSRGAHRRQR